MATPADIQIVTELKGRIAPTPSGYLHKGNGFSFVLTWLLVRKAGGKLQLRIDDADTERARPEYITDIFRCLEWLGLDWDEGPSGPADFSANYSQEKRFHEYAQLLNVLRKQEAVYACSCSRTIIKKNHPDGIYRGTCREKSIDFARPDAAWRIKVPAASVCFWELTKGQQCMLLSEHMGDFVVRRKGGLPAYQIASLSDDLSWGTTHIVRGADLLMSSAAQLYLAQQLSMQATERLIQQKAVNFLEVQFLHHPLILDPKGQKLSKSADSTSLRSLREAGGNPMPVYALVAEYLGLPADAAASLTDLLQAYNELRVND